MFYLTMPVVDTLWSVDLMSLYKYTQKYKNNKTDTYYISTF